MKKLISALLAVVMVLSLACMFVSAEEPAVIDVLKNGKTANYETTPADLYATGNYGVASFVAEETLSAGGDKPFAATPAYTFNTKVAAGSTLYITYTVVENVGGMSLMLRQNNESFDKIDATVGEHTITFFNTVELSSLVVYLKNETKAEGSIKVIFGNATIREGKNPEIKVNKTVLSANTIATTREGQNFAGSYPYGNTTNLSTVAVSDVAALAGNAKYDVAGVTTDKVLKMAAPMYGNILTDITLFTFKKGVTYRVTLNIYSEEEIGADYGLTIMTNGYTNEWPVNPVVLQKGFNTVTFLYTPGADVWNFIIYRTNNKEVTSSVYFGDIEITSLETSAYSEGTLTADEFGLTELGIYTTWEKRVVPGTTTPAMYVPAACIASDYNRVITDLNALYAWDGMDCAHRKVTLNYYLDGDMSELLMHNGGGFFPMPSTKGYHSFEVPAEVLDDDNTYFNIFTCNDKANAADLYIISLDLANDYQVVGSASSFTEASLGVSAKSDMTAFDAAKVYEATVEYFIYSEKAPKLTYSLFGGVDDLYEDAAVLTFGDTLVYLTEVNTLATVTVPVINGATSFTITPAEGTAVVVNTITATEVTDAGMIKMMKAAEKLGTFNLDTAIAVNVELAVNDIRAIAKQAAAADTATYGGLKINEIFVKQVDENRVVAEITFDDGEDTYTTDVTFAVNTGAGTVTNVLPTGDAFGIVVALSIVAILTLAAAVVAKKRIAD